MSANVQFWIVDDWEHGQTLMLIDADVSMWDETIVIERAHLVETRMDLWAGTKPVSKSTDEKGDHCVCVRSFLRALFNREEDRMVLVGEPQPKEGEKPPKRAFLIELFRKAIERETAHDPEQTAIDRLERMAV